MAVSPEQVQKELYNSEIFRRYEGMVDSQLLQGMLTFNIELKSSDAKYREALKSYFIKVYSDNGWSVVITIRHERGDYVSPSYTSMSFKFSSN